MAYGLVTSTTRGFITVRTDEGVLKCRLRGALLRQKSRTDTKLVVVGDRVTVAPLSRDQGLIQEIHERRTKLARRAAGSRQYREQIIAANIDQAILVSAVEDPPYRTNLIDRYAASASQGGIEPVICINKVDLADEEKMAGLTDDLRTYVNRGCQVVLTSTTTGKGLAELGELLSEKISVFAGSSGVGKSSLVNMLMQDEAAETGEVGLKTRKGRHTTTLAEIYELPSGGYVVDTPGMREFGLFDSEDGVDDFFSEISSLAAQCHFSDCSHSHEPGCAVKAALEAQTITAKAYKSYLKLKGR